MTRNVQRYLHSIGNDAGLLLCIQLHEGNDDINVELIAVPTSGCLVIREHKTSD